MRRPSLLTPAQQAEADRNRILSTLEHGSSAAPAPAGSRKRWLFAGLGAGALCLAGAAVVWSSGDTKPADQRVVSATRAPALAVPAVPPVDAPAAAAATIHEEVPADPAVPAAASAIAGTPSISGSVADVPLQKAGGAGLQAALEQPPAKHGAARHAAAPGKPKARPAAHPAAPKAQPDSDMALLSALVAHVQANDADEEDIKEELQACHRLKGSKARQCRSEICTRYAKNDKQCKAIAAQVPKPS